MKIRYEDLERAVLLIEVYRALITESLKLLSTRQSASREKCLIEKPNTA